MTKKQFIQDEVWLLSTLGAFQRANCYEKESKEKDRIEFKLFLKKFIDENLLEKYENSVSELTHVENILLLQQQSKKFGSILIGGKINFGITQKLLNLYLKYLWCLDVIKMPPPHFPVDSIIQAKLGIYDNPWTKFENAEPYIYTIDIAKKKLEESDFASLAELELNLFKE